MGQYLLKFKGKYRLLAELDKQTNDIPRNANGEIDQDDVEIYIACRHNMKITYYGLNESRRGVLTAYIPSVIRGRNIKKELKKQKIEIFDYDESDEEVMFHFNAVDIEPVATLMKAKISGANISPFSKRNLPQRKDIIIPDDEMKKYKEISSKVDKKDMLMFKTWNTAFLNNVLQKKIRKETKDKSYDYKADMKKMKLGRQVKEFIWTKRYWQEYLNYLDKEVKNYYA